MIYTILVEPENPGNVGAVCRVMKNFGLAKLVLLNPNYAKCDAGKNSLLNALLNSEAIKRAKHAGDILKTARVVGPNFLDKLDLLIGTTCKLGTDYNIARTPVPLEDAITMINSADRSGAKVGLVFGREGEGLHNDEIELCDYIVTIPTSHKYRAMNISHAAAIIFYELFKPNQNSKDSKELMNQRTNQLTNFMEEYTPISKREKEVLLSYISKILDKLEFSTKEKKETQKILWKRIIGKANLSRREAFAMAGFWRKVLRIKK